MQYPVFPMSHRSKNSINELSDVCFSLEGPSYEQVCVCLRCISLFLARLYIYLKKCAASCMYELIKVKGFSLLKTKKVEPF